MEVQQVIPKDAIPSIDDPTFGSDYFGDPDDRLIVVEFGGSTQGYPLRILNYHEIVNDEVDGEPIAVTWCPLCGSAVVYSRTVDGRTLSFGVSGKLADDDLVMYDRETDSEWKQSLGHAIAGPLAGRSLTPVLATVITWERFRREYPAGAVLQPPGEPSEAASENDAPAEVDYREDPYAEYFGHDRIGLAGHRGDSGREWQRSDIDPKDPVIGLGSGEQALGVPVDAVEVNTAVSLEVADRSILLLRTESGIHAYRDPGLEVQHHDGATFRGNGTAWNATTGESEDGRRLERVPNRYVFAFAWADDHGSDAFYFPR